MYLKWNGQNFDFVNYGKERKSRSNITFMVNYNEK